MDHTHPGIGSTHPLPPENFQQAQPFRSSEEITTGKGKFDGIIPDGLPPSIKPFLTEMKPNGGSVVFRSPEKEPVLTWIDRRSNRRKVAASLFAAAIIVGAIGIGRLLLRR